MPKAASRYGMKKEANETCALCSLEAFEFVVYLCLINTNLNGDHPSSSKGEKEEKTELW